MATRGSSQFSRTPVYVSLTLALLLVIGALFGARYVFNDARNQPVAMPDLPAPEPDSPQCSALIDALPEKVLGLERAEIAEPVPAGAAAWQDGPEKRVTMRCGVELPFQYTDYAETFEKAGVSWLRVDDMTPESTMATWYSVDRSVVVAITTDATVLGDNPDPLDDFAPATAVLDHEDRTPYDPPLAQLDAVASATPRCTDLMAALPDELAGDWQRNQELTSHPNTAVWTNPGKEPIVVRCGVTPPNNYQAGAQLTQIDEIPWFENDQLVNGSTASNWYALGRDVDIVVSTPQIAAGEALPELGSLIAEHTGEQD